jgi:hypothetical protein
MLLLAVLGLALAALLTRTLVKRFASDHIQRIMDGRRATSRLVTRGEFIDGSRYVPVSLALGALAIYYENQYLQASLDLDWIEEVEYEADLVTGHYAGEGRILRLQCFNEAFEFLIPSDALPRWQTLLPARSLPLSADAPRADATLQAKKELCRADDDGWPTQPAAAVAVAS